MGLTDADLEPYGHTKAKVSLDQLSQPEDKPPGKYIVHYKTDSSHHYGSFDEKTPENPEDWGITIRHVASEAEGDADH